LLDGDRDGSFYTILIVLLHHKVCRRIRLAIGAAQHGHRGNLLTRAASLKTTGANRPLGQTYCRTFSAWIEAHGFAGMQKSVRSVAIELAENIEAIEAWRSTLDERTRRRLVHPLSNVRRWKASLTHGNGKSPQDLRRDAKQALARFCALVRALPAGEAQPLWRLTAAEATIQQLIGCHGR
jgi:hypothetical protein